MMDDIIKQKLQDSLNPLFIELIDQSAAHAGHYGNGGGGHYQLTIVSNAFNGQSAVKRHQLVYQALGDLMKDAIHALSITALTPEENN